MADLQRQITDLSDLLKNCWSKKQTEIRWPARNSPKFFPIRSLENFLKAQDSLRDNKNLENELVSSVNLYLLFLILPANFLACFF